MKRLLSLLIILVFALSAQTAAAADSWATPYLNNLVDRSVMKGDPDGQLYPNRSVTRAEFAALLNRAFGFSEPGSTKFRDVPPTAWYAADIGIASNQGYLQGDSKGANPTSSLTREEAAAMLCRALKIAPVAGEQFRLTDERGFSNWSRGYINAAAEKGFVSGYPNGSFQPKNRITRGEAAKMLSQVAGEIRNSGTQNRLNRTVNGNLTISSSSVTLSDVTVTGDLYITEGVGRGYVQLDNVTVLGEVIISGAGESNVGESSVLLTDCDISHLTVDVAKRKILTLKTDGSTRVGEALIKSSTYLEELSRHYEGFDKVTLDAPAKSFLNLRGNFGEVLLLGAGSVLGLYQGQIGSITVDEAALKSTIALEKDTTVSSLYFDAGATVTGLGEIESVLINNDGAVIAQLPENIYIRPGVTATVGGKKMGFLDAEMDSLSPGFTGDYPKVDLISPTGFTLLYMSNKPGKAYYGVYPAGAARPSLDELMGTAGTVKTALKQGVLNTLPEKEGKVAVSGLKAGTPYVVYSVFVDLRGDDSSILRDTVTTVDNVIPTLLSGYPKVESINRDKATFVLIPNKAASFYWAILPDKAIAPTAEQLYKQTVSGAAVQSATHNGRQNERTDITLADGALSESVAYTFYVVLRDSAGNMSATPLKLSFTTKDLTPPGFVEDYPRVGTPAATAIPLDYMVDEPCTLYWMAVREGTSVLPSEAAKQPEAVKSGTGAFKSGKSTAAKERTKYTLSLSGLEKEMPYDIYLVLEDKAGNLSTAVTSRKTKTLDKTAPTAVVSTPQPINGKFGIDRPITIEFSEIVCGTDAKGNPQKLSELFPARSAETVMKELKNYIRLVDLTDTSYTTPPEVPINWSRVTVRDYNAKTEITFLGAEYNDSGVQTLAGALSLVSDNRYQFVVGHSYPQGYLLRDTSQNEMKEKTALTFQTVPSLCYFTEVKTFNAAKYDSAFLLRPDKQNTGPNIYFDILLRSDQAITFDLYKAATAKDLDSATVPVAENCVLPAAYATPLSSYDKKSILYKELPPTYYGIKLKKLGDTVIGSSGSPVTATVNLKLNGVIGNVTYLRALSGAETTTDNLEKRIKTASDRGDLSEVTAPSTPFTLRVGLVDSIPPTQIGAPSLTAGDTQLLMKLKTDKACTVYYLAFPVAETDSDPDDPSGSIPTAAEIQGSSSNLTRGIAAGSFQASGGIIAAEHTITGLLPAIDAKPRDYKLYYFLKGAAPKPSEVYGAEFQTVDIQAPKNTSRTYLSQPNGAKVTIQWNMDCTVYYVVYQKGYTAPNAEQIINPTLGADLIDSGSFTVKSGVPRDLSITKLTETTKYSIFMVAQRYIGTAPAGAPSPVYSIPTMMPLDQSKPAIAGGVPNYTVSYNAVSGTFEGEVSVTFTEALYYFEQGTTAKPLTIAAFTSNKTGPGSSNVLVNKSNSIEDIVELLNANGDPLDPPQTENCLRSISFTYADVAPGTTVEFAKTIGDRALNYAGTFKLTFQVDPTDPTNAAKATWTASFIPAK